MDLSERGLGTEPVDTEAGYGESWDESVEALEGHIAADEQVIAAADALLRVSMNLFDRCELVLTDRELIVLKPSWPWGMRHERGIPKSACRVKKAKSRVDGSQLFVVATEDEDLCFYFPRRSKEGGVAIMEAIGSVG